MRCLLVLLLSVATVTVTVVMLLFGGLFVWGGWPWVRFLIPLGLVLAGSWVGALEWARLMFAGFCLIMALSLVLILMAVGRDTILDEEARGRADLITAAFNDRDQLGVVASQSGIDANVEPLDRALEEACAALRVDLQDERCPDAEAGEDTESDPAEAVNPEGATAKAQLELATYQAAVTGDPDDAEARDELLAAQNTPAEQDESDYVDALARGPQAVVDSLTSGDDPALVPGPVGWAVLGVGALAWWSWMARRNLRQLPGPVELDDKATDPALRIAVLQNISEPGAAPGAASVKPVTDLLSVEPLKGPGAIIKALVEAVSSVAGRTAGYRVAVDHHEAAGGARGRHQVLVRISDRTSGAQRASRLVENHTKDDALRSAGLWAAGWILSQSTRVPTWAGWRPESGDALGAANANDPSISKLQEAVRLAPDNGLLLCLLGSKYELRGSTSEGTLEAINLYARAVAAHPRYFQPTYRLASALSMAAGSDSIREQWLSEPSQMRQRRTGQLERAANAAAARRGNELGEPLRLLDETCDTDGAKNALAKLAVAFFEELVHRTKRRYIIAATLRRSERVDTTPAARTILTKHGMARRAYWLAESGRLIANRRLTGQDDQKSETRARALAREQESWWQLSYNLACLAAVRNDPNDALTLLEQCLSRPNVGQLKAEWVTKDLDLTVLQNDVERKDRFRRFVEQLEAPRPLPALPRRR